MASKNLRETIRRQNTEVEIEFDDPSEYKKRDNRKRNHNHRDDRRKKEVWEA